MKKVHKQQSVLGKAWGMKRENYHISPAPFKLQKRDWSSLSYISNSKRNKNADLVGVKSIDNSFLWFFFWQNDHSLLISSHFIFSHLQCLKKAMNFAVEMLLLVRSHLYVILYFYAFGKGNLYETNPLLLI